MAQQREPLPPPPTPDDPLVEVCEGICMRCGSDAGFLVVSITNKAWEAQLLCIESCAKRPWTPCPKCSGRPKAPPMHVKHCAVGYPDYRARWEAQLEFHQALVAKLLPMAAR